MDNKNIDYWNIKEHAVKETERETAIFLNGFAEVQRRITDSTRTLLRTVASMPEIRGAHIENSRVILSTLLETNPIYTNVILVDLKGNVIVAGKNYDKAKQFNFADRKQFKEAIASRRFASGEFVVGKSSLKAILMRVAVTSLFSLALALAIAWFIGGHVIARRLEKLTQVTKRFGHGETQVASNIDYNDGEVGELAKSFDNMVFMLHERENERNTALEQLSASELRFRELIEEVSGISVQGYDENRNVTFWNHSSEKLYGFTKQEAFGNKLEDLIIPKEMKPVDALDDFTRNPDKFDLVMTDMSMPKMSGDKLASKLLSIRPNIPIILCTGFSENILSLFIHFF